MPFKWKEKRLEADNEEVESPLDWSPSKRWGHVVIVSMITFVSPLASSMLAPAMSQIMDEFHFTDELLSSFVVSVFVLGFAAGPLVIAPLSEIYGRLIFYNICNVLFLIFNIAGAVSSGTAMLTVFRFFAGFAGSAPLTLGGGTISDVIPLESRGKAMALYALGPLSGVLTIITFAFMQETYLPILVARKRRRAEMASDNSEPTEKRVTEIFKLALVRPLKLLLFSPIVLLLSTFMATVYGYLYLLFTTFGIVFEGEYGFGLGTSGLAFLGIGIGNFIGLGVFGLMSDRILKRLKSQTGESKPEHRLPPMFWGSIFIPVGLFWYGWTAEKHVHWIVPIIGTSCVGIGAISIFMPVQTYLVDAYDRYAASALAANTVLRSLAGAFLPLAGPNMYRSLGLGWGNSLLAFIALAMLPVPWFFYVKGEAIRKSFKRQL
ncbi:hypothetical protein ZTR_11012 [Talaromyces verruculosus]|nr:hypothetical protein ZTR_11012 [Talaromyces verruculosus]